MFAICRAVCTPDELQGIGKQLTELFKVPLSGEHLRKLEYDFHSANHTILNEIVVGLRTVTGYLVKALEEPVPDINALKSKSVTQFLLSLFQDKEDYIAALNEIGIKSAQPSHLSCLADLNVCSTYNCLELFVEWVDEERYDFCLLPFPLKVHMNFQDEKLILSSLRQNWKGSINDLKEDSHQLLEVLKHSEQDITRRVKEFANVRECHNCP